MHQCKKRARGHRGRDVLTDGASAQGRDGSAQGKDALAQGKDASAQGKDASAQGKDASAHNLQLDNHSKGHKMEEPRMAK
jgi:hypothetical protein